MLISILIYGRLKYISFENLNDNKLLDFITPAALVLINILPDELFGSEKKLKKKYTALYGEKDCSIYILKSRVRTAAYFYLLSIIFISILFFVAFQEQRDLNEMSKISRPEWNESPRTYRSKAVLKYEDQTFVKDVTLNVQQQVRNENEIEKALDKTKKRIRKEVLGSNKDLNHIYKKLNFFTFDAETGAVIKWATDASYLIDCKGNVNSDKINSSQRVHIKAQLKIQDKCQTYSLNVTVVPFESQAALTEIAEKKIQNIVKKINNSQSFGELILPHNVDGINITWLKNEKSSFWFIMIIMMATFYLLFANRYEKVNKKIKLKRYAIERDFPDFMSKLVLLLNAGLIVQSAVEKMVYDYLKYYRDSEKSPLYEELSQAVKNAKEINASFIFELKSFAVRCQVREVMRFVSIVSENIHMGSELTNKLQTEADQMWQNRKLKAEELGRLADTKLTFPLLIFLLVIIVIIITPAFMEM